MVPDFSAVCAQKPTHLVPGLDTGTFLSPLSPPRCSLVYNQPLIGKCIGCILVLTDCSEGSVSWSSSFIIYPVLLVGRSTLREEEATPSSLILVHRKITSSKRRWEQRAKSCPTTDTTATAAAAMEAMLHRRIHRNPRRTAALGTPCRPFRRAWDGSVSTTAAMRLEVLTAITAEAEQSPRRAPVPPRPIRLATSAMQQQQQQQQHPKPATTRSATRCRRWTS